MSLVILIIDDDPMSLADSKRVAAGMALPGMVVHACLSVPEGFAWLQSQGPADLILSDVEMPDIDGFSAISILGDRCLRFVYLSGYVTHLDKSNDTDADAFLLKPLRANQLLKQVRKLQANTVIAHESDTLRFIHDGAKRRDVAVSIDEITLVEGHGDYIKVHVGGRIYTAHQTLKGFLEEPGMAQRFIRIQKSFIVAFNAIDSIAEDMVKLKDGGSFPVGDAFKEEINAFRKARIIANKLTK